MYAFVNRKSVFQWVPSTLLFTTTRFLWGFFLHEVNFIQGFLKKSEMNVDTLISHSDNQMMSFH